MCAMSSAHSRLEPNIFTRPSIARGETPRTSSNYTKASSLPTARFFVSRIAFFSIAVASRFRSILRPGEEGRQQPRLRQYVFWPNDVETAKVYFKAMAGPYMDNISLSDEIVEVWATEMHGNRSWLEKLGMKPAVFPLVEFPELAGSDCVQVLDERRGPDRPCASV
jgi:hypothetical protein